MEENISKNMKASKEKKPIDIVNEVSTDLRKYRRQFEKNWRDEDDAYHGKIWKNTDGYRPYENFMFTIVENEVPILTDSYPGVVLRTHVEEMKPQVENLGKSVEWVLKNQNFQIKLPEVVRSSLKSAPGFLYTYYDPNAKDGQGEDIIEELPWRQVYLNGNTRYIETAETARIELYRSKTWLKLKYPRFAKEIDGMSAENEPGDASDNKDDGAREQYDSGSYTQRRPPNRYRSESILKLVLTYVKDFSTEKISDEQTEEELQSESSALNEGNSPDVTKWQNHPLHVEYHQSELNNIKGRLRLPEEAEYADIEQAVEQAITENPELEEELAPLLIQYKVIESHIQAHLVLSEENPKGHKLKYKNGSRVIETIQKTVMYDGENKDDHSEIPIVPFYCYRNGTIYGDGEIRNTLDSQRMQATLQYKEFKGLQRVANPAVIVDEETGLEASDITNEDGSVYVIPQGTNIRDKSPGQVSSQIAGFNDDRKNAIKDISGVNEATQGTPPTPGASGIAIEKTQQQAIGRIRLKDRQNQGYSIKRLGKLIGSNIIQYWSYEKTLAIEGEDDSLEALVYNPLEMTDLMYEVDVAPGSMAGVDKQSFNYLLSSFMDKGNMSFDQFLQVAEIPRASKIRKIVGESEQINGQLEQLRNENIMLKAANNIEMLNPEEMQVYEELMRQKALEEAQTGATNGQPIQEGQ
jgi:hypothetical protein